MITILNDIDLRPFNTFRISAVARKWIEYTSVEDIPSVAAMIKGSRFINIGSGSNLLFTRSVYDGSILHSRILDVTMAADGESSVIVRAGAGIVLDDLIGQCADAGLWGLENLSGIPGEVGASAVQNVGAYGVEACDCINAVECYDTANDCFKRFMPDDCQYGYRDSIFKHERNRYIITYVEFRLSNAPQPNINYGSLKNSFSNLHNVTPTDIRNAVIAIRNEKLPDVDVYGSAGSFFKNPVVSKDIFNKITAIATEKFNSDVPHYIVEDGVKIPAAWFIDKCGFKGYTLGNAAVWEKQPLVIVNLTGKARAEEIIAIEKKIKDNVQATFGIELSPEVEHV